MRKTKKDSRLFARIDLDYADHPKIAGLSDAAFRAHIEMILWSRKYLTDGRIPKRVANRLGSDAVAELLANDEEHPSLVETDDGDYVLHGFVDMQETKAEVSRRSAVNQANGSLGGRPKGTRSVTDSDSGSVSETEPVRQAETETETETSPNGEVVRKRPSASRGARIPEPFVVTRDMRSWASEEVPGLDVDAATRKFVDYWRAETGAKAAKKDWTAAWRFWLRRDHERMSSRRPSPVERGLSLVERMDSREQGAIGA